MLLAGCKIVDDKVDAGFTGEGSTQSGGRGGSVSADSPPTIWGDPETSVLVDTGYAFMPEADDADGDVLEFSIENKPGWASFSRSTGLLQGVPGSQHAGDHANIVISVADSNSVTSLPSFDVVVATVPDSGGDTGSGSDSGTGDDTSSGSSAAPTISGEPNTSAVAGNAYSFQPEAVDPEGDTLSFSIVNKPVWATFDTTSGRLQGTPTSSHLGTSNPIEISVTDGTSIAALPTFTITVEAVGTVSKTLQWTPPSQNEDGTPLTDLAGYRIYYGTTPGEYGEMVELSSPGVTSYVIDGLAPGTYYLVMTSFTASDLESRYTPEISFELGT